MRNLQWGITSFTSIASFPSKNGEGSAIYAQDMLNLRVDRWGHLRLRPAIKSFVLSNPPTAEVTGLASGGDVLFWLLSNGTLHVSHDGDPTPSNVSASSISDLSGRLSIVNEVYGGYALTSEGEDNGFLLQHPTESLVARTLGVPTPSPPVFDVLNLSTGGIGYTSFGAHNRSGDTSIQVSGSGAQVGHRFTIGNTTHTIISINANIWTIRPALASNLPANTTLTLTGEVGTVENSQDYAFYKLTYSVSELADIESEATDVFAVQYANDPDSFKVRFQIPATAIPNPLDDRVEYLNLYRSDRRSTDPQDPERDEFLYYRVGQNRRPTLPIDWVVLDDEPFDEHNAALLLHDNSKMPSSITALAKFNDRLFGANGDELRFSEVRNGTPSWGAWPVVNSIKPDDPDRIDFCATYRGQLLFGGPTGLYRLSGSSLATFRYDKIGSRGPVSAYSGAVLDNTFGFVGVDGFYLTDGTQSPEISGRLEGVFNRYSIDEGVVGMLPSKAALFGARRNNAATRRVDNINFIFDDGNWTRFEGDDETVVRQVASVAFDGRPVEGFIADQQHAPRQLDWRVTDDDSDADSPIPWLWESNQLDWNADGLGEMMKIFEELVISGVADNDVTVTFYPDNLEPTTATVTLDRERYERFDPVRVPIRRRGFALRFNIEGMGQVTLRGLKVGATVG